MNSLEGRLSQKYQNHLFEIQKKIASHVILEDCYSTKRVAGVDQAFADNLVISGAVVLDKSLAVIGKASFFSKASFPYIPGLLSFREGPAAIRAVRKITQRPTLLFVDGCGINHPRLAGLASLVGVLTNLPTIGITKNVLCGEFEVPEMTGESTPLLLEGKHIGYLLKTKKNCRPIVIAPGHRVSIESSLDLTRKYLVGDKLPLLCKLAHDYVNQVKRDLTMSV